MSAPRDLESTRAYYDEFANAYERHRHDPRGYHALLDDLEIDLTERYGAGRDVLECGCGTGLLLDRIAKFARSAKGIDLSPGMLEQARARGLEVREGSVTALPFDAASFDVTCSFKVLAHVPEIGKALAEMARVTRPGGVVLAEFYNPLSLRALAKRVGRPGKISEGTRENAVYTRLLPPGVHVEAARGVRIVTPAALAMRIPGLRRILWKAEHALADTRASFFGGFYVAVLRKS
jgi:ubiquinone/menaquinone biosynthesis C-methylase UbiE